MPTFAAYVGAALAEIAGCFAFWTWIRLSDVQAQLAAAPERAHQRRLGAGPDPDGGWLFLSL